MQVYNYEFGNDEFTYDPAIEEVEKEIKQILFEKTAASPDAQRVVDYMVDELDLLEVLEEQFYEELTDIFEERARREYKNIKANREDLDDWYGTKSNAIGV